MEDEEEEEEELVVVVVVVVAAQRRMFLQNIQELMQITETSKCTSVSTFDIILCFRHGVTSSLLWQTTRRTFIVIYRRFGITYRYQLQGSSRPKIPLGLLDPR
jgi:hypothetical protein